MGRPTSAGGPPAGGNPNARVEEDDSVWTRRIYVGSVFWDISDNDLRSIFAPFGRIRACGLMVRIVSFPAWH